MTLLIIVVFTGFKADTAVSLLTVKTHISRGNKLTYTIKIFFFDQLLAALNIFVEW